MYSQSKEREESQMKKFRFTVGKFAHIIEAESLEAARIEAEKLAKDFMNNSVYLWNNNNTELRISEDQWFVSYSIDINDSEDNFTNTTMILLLRKEGF